MAPSLILCVVVLVGAVLATSATLQANTNLNADFDYFYLVRQWPATFCNDHYCTHRPPKKYAFTVHGLWPQRRDGTWPEFCDSSSVLDMDEIEDLLPELEKAWPSWSSADETFWSHEWTRHGTCAEGIVGHQHDFFQTVLRLHNKLDVQEAFEARDVVPSNIAHYHVEALKQALDDAYGVMPHITCDAQGQLAEVWMCIDKKLRPIDCVDGPHPHRIAQLRASTGSPAGSAAAAPGAVTAAVPANFNCNLVKLPKLDKEKFKAAKKAAKRAAKAAAKRHKEEDTAEQKDSTAAEGAAMQQVEATAVSTDTPEQQQQPTWSVAANDALGIAANSGGLMASTAKAPAGAAGGDSKAKLPSWVIAALLVAAVVAMVAAVVLQLVAWASNAKVDGREPHKTCNWLEERSPLIAGASV